MKTKLTAMFPGAALLAAGPIPPSQAHSRAAEKDIHTCRRRYDPTRDKNPVDGGVFDMQSGDREQIIPIDSKLQADQPAAFALTLEKPGGVVVSEGPLLVLAKVGG